MIYKKHILTKSDLTSHIHLSYIKLAKESIEYKIVKGKLSIQLPKVKQIKTNKK